MKEVQLKRVAGPYEEPPFEFFIQSPIGLVPKDGGKKTRLIFHLSYPKKTDQSVNAQIDKSKCSVKYPDFEVAVAMCIAERANCKMGKSDFSAAFRHVPMSRSSWPWLLMMAKKPVNGKTYYFVEQ